MKRAFSIILFATPLLQAVLTWDLEEKVTTDVFNVSYFYPELFLGFLLIFLSVSYIKRTDLILYLCILALFLTGVISGIINNNRHGFQHFLISLDFIFYGVLWMSIRKDFLCLKTIRILLLLLFVFLALQQIILAVGFTVYIEQKSYLNNLGDVYRTGTTAGSAISTGYILIFLMGILNVFYPETSRIKLYIKALCFVAVVFTFSRGPILTYIATLLFSLKEIRLNIKKHKINSG